MQIRSCPVIHGRIVAASLVALLAAACATHRPAPPPHVEDTARAARVAHIAGLELLGQAEIATGLVFEETVVGGLSAITYDSERDRYYAVSDDPSSLSPARFYTLRIDLGSGALASDGVEIEAVTTLRDRSGLPFELLLMDSEGITLTPHGTLLISSEGNVLANVPPSLREFGLDGRQRRQIPLPSRYLPEGDSPVGVRHNLALEALAWAAAGDGFYLGTENALRQDGKAADLGQGSPARIMRFDYDSGEIVAEYVYRVEPVAEPPAAADGFRTNGLVELLDAGGGELLALERSYSEGAGNTVRLFAVSIHGATDVRELPRLDVEPAAGITAVTKRLLLDLATLALPLDNLEGLTFGPPLADGRRALLVISDDNFSPAQRTQILAFAATIRQRLQAD